MTRVKKILRFVAAMTSLWMVAGAGWPMETAMDTAMEILGRIRCC